MTQEDKELLLKDLCARLPYGVKVEIDGYYSHILKGIDGDTISTDRGINYPLRLVKPYLRPMSSMTDEEKEEFGRLVSLFAFTEANDWLNSHHFDYRRLIEKGLAIDCTELNIY